MNEITELVLVLVSVYWPALLGILALPFAIVGQLTGHWGTIYIALILGAMLAAVMSDRTLREATT